MKFRKTGIKGGIQHILGIDWDVPFTQIKDVGKANYINKFLKHEYF